jgi:hypothetical protein
VDFRERELDFQGADRRYAEFTRQHDAGSISDEEFEARRQLLMVRDEEGHWWAKLGESGEWHYREGGTWIRGTPPVYREEVVPELTLDFEEVDRRYAQLKELHQAGEITEEAFDEQLQRLMVQDESGRWWAKSRKSGEWHYNDGRTWVRGMPPGYAPPTHATRDQSVGEQGRRVATSTAVPPVRNTAAPSNTLAIALPFAALVLLIVVAFGVFQLSYVWGGSTDASSESASPESASPTPDTVVPDLRGKTVREASQTVGTDYVLEVGNVFGKVRNRDFTDNQPKGIADLCIST